MGFGQSIFRRQRAMGLLGRFLVITCLAAAGNFANIFVENWRAANASGTHSVDGYEISICYFGPPISFYARFLVLTALLVASVGVFRRAFPRSILATGGVAVAMTVYVCWWLKSYRLFRNFTDYGINFLENSEIKQVAYLYKGSWSDVCVMLALGVCFVLLLERLFAQRAAI